MHKFGKILLLSFSLLLCSALMPSLLGYIAKAATPDDAVPVVATDVDSLPDGGSVYHYTIDGTDVSCPVPPMDFNPLTATDDQLNEYGFPARPTDAAGLADWENEMSFYTYTAVPDLSVEKTDSDQTAEKPKISKNSSSGLIALMANLGGYADAKSELIWSGYENYKATYSAVEGDFTQPLGHLPTVDGATLLSWVGIGGDNTGSLLQTGTEIVKNLTGSFTYSAWYEWLEDNNPSGTISIKIINNISIHPNDHIHLAVSYATSLKKVSYTVWDLTTGVKLAPIVATFTDNDRYDGSTVEWVDERMRHVYGNAKVQTPLLNYYRNNWSSCQSYTSSGWANCNTRALNSFTMYSDDWARKLSQPSPVTSGSFTDVYYNCQ